MVSNRAVPLLDKKRKKEEGKSRGGEVKADIGKVPEEEKKREKPKAHAPSHAKFRSTGLCWASAMSLTNEPIQDLTTNNNA